MRTNLLGDLFRDVCRLTRMGAKPAEVALDAGAWAIATYRVGRKLRSLPRALGAPLLLLHSPFELLVRALTGVRLPSAADIGGGLYLGHIGDITIAPGAHLGRDVNLSHGASLAEASLDGARGAPFVGDRVYIGPGARLRGPIRIGNDAIIAANAIVERDVADGESVAGAPAVVIPLQARAIVRGRKPRPPVEALRVALRRTLPRPLPLLIGR